MSSFQDVAGTFFQTFFSATIMYVTKNQVAFLVLVGILYKC